MTYTATITLDDDIYAFLEGSAGDNRSAYINNTNSQQRGSISLGFPSIAHAQK